MAKASEKSKLWRAFSEFIRLRDSPGGFGMCISCNKPVPYPNSTGKWHAGHYLPRSATYNALWFHEKNVAGQCRYCNSFMQGAQTGFREGLIRRYGQKVLEELEQARAAGQLRKWYDHDYKEMAKEYRKKVRAMKKERGLA